MSLYFFGKIICESQTKTKTKSKLEAIALENYAHVDADNIDDEDLLIIEEVEILKGSGVAFSIYSNLSETDAILLWEEAMKAAREVFLQQTNSDNDIDWTKFTGMRSEVVEAVVETRLGCICLNIMEMENCSSGGIALVDGGIEKFCQGTKKECFISIAKDVLLTWDQCPNKLYVWHD